MFTAEAHQIAVTEVVTFNERDCRFQGFMGFGTVLDDHFLALTGNGYILIHLYIGRHPQHKSHDKPDTYLPDNLVFAFQSLFVTAENLDIIIHSTEKSQPYGSNNHQDEIDVSQSAKEQNRHKNGENDNDSTHRRNANLLDTKGVYRGVALCFCDLFTL